ncbi:MAG TPA: geopeptide radical SAM maturase [Geobacteraceae bacterium]
MPLSRYRKIYPCPEKPGYYLLYSTRKGSTVRVSAALLAAAREGSLTKSECEELRRLEIVVDDPVAEVEAMAGLVARANARRNRFRALAVLTLDCNLACPYCFEDPFRSKVTMTPDTARLLVETVIRDYMEHGRDVEIDFYGGECLLSVGLIRAIARPLHDAALVRGTKFSFFLITNGTLLTRPLVEELLPLGLGGAQVTLDGPREIHDFQRPFVSGKGSFDVIVANIKAVCDLISVRVGGNCTPANYRQFPRLLDVLLEEGISPERIGLVQFGPVVPKAGKTVGPDSVSGCVSSSEPWLREAGPYLREETLKRGFRADKPTMAACMVEFANDLVVNYDGTLYKCPAFMGWPELAIGTLADGVRDYSASHNLDVWKNDECLDCAYLPICFGGCRYMTLLRTGAMNEVDCRREFYDATLEQIIRQDLALRSLPA